MYGNWQINVEQVVAQALRAALRLPCNVSGVVRVGSVQQADMGTIAFTKHSPGGSDG